MYFLKWKLFNSAMLSRACSVGRVTPVRAGPLMIWGAEKMSDTNFFFLTEGFLIIVPGEGPLKLMVNH